MIREALSQRMPSVFEGVDPLHYFATNQIEEFYQIGEFLKHILLECDFFKRRIMDEPISMSDMKVFTIFMQSGWSPEKGSPTENESNIIFKKVKERLDAAFPHLTKSPWNSNFRFDDSYDISFRVSSRGRGGNITFYLKMYVPSTEKLAPQYHRMMEIENRMVSQESKIFEEIVRYVDEMEEIQHHYRMKDATEVALSKEIDAISKHIEQLIRRRNTLDAFRRTVIHNMKREIDHIVGEAHDQCEREGVFNPIYEERNREQDEAASWHRL